jgi:hypothetical protein
VTCHKVPEQICGLEARCGRIGCKLPRALHFIVKADLSSMERAKSAEVEIERERHVKDSTPGAPAVVATAAGSHAQISSVNFYGAASDVSAPV